MKQVGSFIALFVLLSVWSSVDALRCYKCEARDERDLCVTNPSRGAAIVSCPDHFQCTVHLKERVDFSGRFMSLSRGCDQFAVAHASSNENGVAVSVSTQSCSQDLCNVGNGIDGIGNGFSSSSFASSGSGFSRSGSSFSRSGVGSNPLWSPWFGFFTSLFGFRF